MTEKELLKKANRYFENSEYEKALNLYSHLIAQNPTNEEYKLYPIICDIAFEDPNRAEALFDFIQIEKSLNNLDFAIDYVKKTIKAYDGNTELMLKLIKDIAKNATETLEAIDYKDFLNIVNQKGSFKRAFEDIMFSTKIAINSKEDLIDFINKLIENNFENTAYSYLDGFSQVLKYDEDINRLFKKLKRNKSENNQQKI